MSTLTAVRADSDAAPEPIRIVTAASLFDGHDASINIMRRLLQSLGAEVIHLGHDRSVGEVAEAAVEEDAHGVAVSSYQGGHMEYFRFLVDQLRERGAGHIRVFGGGGGTILPHEIEALQGHGVARLFSPEDGRVLGLEGMIRSILDDCGAHRRPGPDLALDPCASAPVTVARWISWLEAEAAEHKELAKARERLQRLAGTRRAPVLGLTGPGGAGKSSLLDELVLRLRRDHPDRRLGVVLVDPSRRRTGGALLGDRLRMNAMHGPEVYVRSLATRHAHQTLSSAVRDAILVLQAARYDLVIVETAGTGQSDSQIVDQVDVSMYVMTPEYGAPSQLEKIDMLEFAQLVVLNKSDRPGALDALRDVRKQWKRNHKEFSLPDAEVPVYPCVARQWSDPGLERVYAAVAARLGQAGWQRALGTTAPQADADQNPAEALIPRARTRYLAEIAETVRGYRNATEAQAQHASQAQGLSHALGALGDPPRTHTKPIPGQGEPAPAPSEAVATLREHLNRHLAALDADTQKQLATWPKLRHRYQAETQSYRVRGRQIPVRNHVETLSHTRLPKVATPRTEAWGDLVRYLRQENLPGHFPFTAGVFPFKREGEEPARMFAGEGDPERTNRRFHYLSKNQPAARLSTAFDSVTLYGRDPHPRPDVYGKVGNSGVSVCTLDDAKKLYSGFDLCDSKTSVSMTINGPAPVLLAFFLNAAIDQQVEAHLAQSGELAKARQRTGGDALPAYRGEVPETHNRLGLGLLGVAGDQAVDPETYARIKAKVLQAVRGTVQADILKEDQAQNTCIFSTDFSLKLMGDIQAYFVEQQVRNFYSVSVSGYHIAEAGANPITQLAFTLANGFTYCEYYLARGMQIDAFAPNLSFFFSNGLDAEYNVIGRVARRIWALAMRERYGAQDRSQKLKYHVQTSGRSLHAQEMAFNDIRTTLQALMALSDHCNSLHTNAYDEAVTTPTEESVRRALAIQLIIQRELGLGKCENPLQGAYVMEQLTDLVEEAVLQEFERLSERGGVLGAMETLYQRSKIQDESLYYESLKHTGELPVIGVNTFEAPGERGQAARPEAIQRSSEHEKQSQLANLRAFQQRHQHTCGPALRRLQEVARAGDNVFEELMETVKHASLGQISEALFEVGGRYRRAM